jgi:hypothetical protein
MNIYTSVRHLNNMTLLILGVANIGCVVRVGKIFLEGMHEGDVRKAWSKAKKVVMAGITMTCVISMVTVLRFYFKE